MIVGVVLPLIGAAYVGHSAPAVASVPSPGDFADVSERTALSYVNIETGVRVGTANETEPRPGLSTIKLYLVDYVIRNGDGNADDRDRAERMIRFSDDWAASQIDAEFPEAIDAIAEEYGLTATARNGYWGDSTTSTADVVRFLEAKKRSDPDSPVLEWMAAASTVATDGTVQDWGTGRLVGVVGSKWGWADDRSTVVASASFGEEFIVAANTYGSDTDQTEDVLGALGDFDLEPSRPALPAYPTVMDVILQLAPR